MRKWFILTTMICLCLVPALAVQAAPRLLVDDPVWNLGIIIDKQSYEKVLTVTNAGDEPLVIEKIEECCGFYVALEGKPRLLPGERALLKLTVSTFKMVGELRAEALVYSNDPVMPRFSIFALGQVVPKEHALGELAQGVLDLGVVVPGDRLPFAVRVRNSGNLPLAIRQTERPATVAEVSAPATIAPGTEAELRFEYLPERSGPIEDRLTITTNDVLNRTLTFQLKGYVSRQAVADHALVLQPVGKVVDYDPQSRTFPYRFAVLNQSPREVEILSLESSLPVAAKRFDKRIEAGRSVDGEVLFEPQTGQVPARGYLYLLLAIPVEVR